MNARSGQFWLFQAVFWSIAGTALFISGATQMPVYEALVRNFFLLIVGFLSSFFLAMVIDEFRWMKVLRLRVISYSLAYVVALFCVVVINAINHALRGIPFAEISFGQWFGGALNLGLVYAFWSELFIQQIYLTDRVTPTKPAERIVVESRGRPLTLSVDDIQSIGAAGDYVEIRANGHTYLNRQTLHSLEAAFGDEFFVRVHRSWLVNRRHVQSVAPLSKGRYQLHLADDFTVASSRGYRDVVRQTFLVGAS